MALLVYVHDIIVTVDHAKEKKFLSQCLAKEFEMKGVGRLNYFLGIEVAHSRWHFYLPTKVCYRSPQRNRQDSMQTSK